MIIINNEELLRVKCEDVTPEEVAPLREALQNELNYSNKLGKFGIGLAAPQIGIAKNFAIVRLEGISIDLVNCKIEKAYDQTMFRNEGCLSFPGRVENTMRFQEIYLTNNLVTPHNFILTGLPAIVVQHELDHTNGILLPDRAIIKLKQKAGPNDPCPCGEINVITGKTKKFKKCCANK